MSDNIPIIGYLLGGAGLGLLAFMVICTTCTVVAGVPSDLGLALGLMGGGSLAGALGGMTVGLVARLRHKRRPPGQESKG